MIKFVLPRRVRKWAKIGTAGSVKRFGKGPAGIEPPAGARIRKKTEIKNEEVVFVLQEHNTGEYRVCI